MEDGIKQFAGVVIMGKNKAYKQILDNKNDEGDLINIMGASEA